MIDAPRATPEKLTPAAAPLPAAMPATCVPCSQASVGVEQLIAAPGPSCVSVPLGQSVVLVPRLVLEKHASSRTLPDRNGWLESTPVSRMATNNPVPS